MVKEELIKQASERIFHGILESTDGDYITQAQVLKCMKPQGW